jgi:UDP-2,3-diacylglucosamine hydrolase
VKAIFISDAHLKRSSDERYRQLIHFLNDIKAGKVKTFFNPGAKKIAPVYIDNLYIAGDLFDFWFCRKENIYPEFGLIIAKLIELQKAGIRIYLFEGNHDFFMGEYFRDVLGMEVSDEWANLKLDNKNVLIGHGDTADRTNVLYIVFRKILRSRAFYCFQRFIPASILWGIASLGSAVSKELNKENGDELFEKMTSFALAKLRENYDVVIFGHSHKPIARYIEIAGKEKTFIGLGDWIKHYSFLYYEDGKFNLGYYRPC